MRWYQRFFRRGLTEKHLDAELRFHLEQQIADYIAAGITPEEARRRARLEFGGIDQVKEECRDVGTAHLLETLAQDVRYGLRMLRKNPGFTAAAVITLALGIGANTAIFAVVNSFLLRPLPVREPGQLVVIASKERHSRFPHRVSYPDYVDLRRQVKVFGDVVAYMVGPVNMSGQGRIERIWVEGVTANYFSMLGVSAVRGRTFLAEEGQMGGGQPIMVLSYDFWVRQFAGDLSVLGKSIDLNNRAFVVLGIAPESFPGTEALIAPDAYIPLVALDRLPPGPQGALRQRDNRGLRVMARLQPNISLDEANAAVKVLGRQLESEYQKTNEGVSFTVIPETRARPDPADATLLPQVVAVFMTLVGLVLVIACANFAGLMLARAMAQEREMAIRAALGASRLRLMRQVVIEGALFGLFGGAAGLLLAIWATHVLSAIKLPTDIPVRLFTPTLDWRVFSFTLGVSLLTGVIAGLAPALRGSTPNFHTSLKEDARGTTASLGRQRLRSLLVVLQITVTVLLLLCSGLFIRSLNNAEHMDLGFRTDHLLMLSADLGMQGYDKIRTQTFYRELLERVKGQPWTRSASLARFVPLGSENGGALDVFTEEHPSTSKEPALSAFYNVIGLDYFKTMGTRLLRGRDFTEQDNESSPKVAIISETMARQLWPGRDPVGKRIRLGRGGSYAQVVGVVRDIKFTLPYSEAQAFIYLPLLQDYQSEVTLLVHTSVDADGLLAAARAQLLALDPNLPAYDVKTMARHIREGVALLPVRLAATLVGTFGLIGLLLAVVGLYGIVSFFVAQRTHEIGVRIALGARQVEILKLVLWKGIVLTLIGVAVGLGLGIGVTRLIAGMLYDTRPTDPLTFAGVVFLLTAVALFASYLPARRATKVDPMVALRYE
jgi:predicted permease